MSCWSFYALGVPAPQGSKRGFLNPKNGRVIITEDSKRTKPWRQVIVDAAEGAGPCLEGPLSVVVTFTVPKPKSTRKGDLGPFKKPDIDKLTRALFDAVTSCGLWHDDAQVAHLQVNKAWPIHVKGSLPVPGVIVAAKEFGDRTDLVLAVDEMAERVARTHRGVSTPDEALHHIKEIREVHSR